MNPTSVAQVSNLPYRRFPIARAFAKSMRSSPVCACRLEIRDTAQRGNATTKGAQVCDPQQLRHSERSGNRFDYLEPLALLRLTELRSGPQVCDPQRLRQPERLSND